MSLFPNLFIAGAAKSGTSTLFDYLQHSDYFFCPYQKEPKFLTRHHYGDQLAGPGDKIYNSRISTTLEHYLANFQKAKPGQWRVDSSADTLYYYKETIPQILEHQPDARIIIILRNPMNRAFSAWTHLIRDNRETLSFEKGLEAESTRIDQGYEFIWHYRSAGLYADAVEAFTSSFKHVKVLIFREFIKDPVRYINEIYQFLEIPAVFELSETIHKNESVITKRNFIGNLLFYKYKLPFYSQIKKKLLIFEPVFRKLIGRLKTSKSFKMSVKPATYNQLLSFYLTDIERIEKILGKELPFWKEKME